MNCGLLDLRIWIHAIIICGGHYKTVYVNDPHPLRNLIRQYVTWNFLMFQGEFSRVLRSIFHTMWGLLRRCGQHSGTLLRNNVEWTAGGKTGPKFWDTQASFATKFPRRLPWLDKISGDAMYIKQIPLTHYYFWVFFLSSCMVDDFKFHICGIIFI